MSEHIPFLDLSAQFGGVRDDVNLAINRVMTSQAFILGPEVGSLESEIARYCGCQHGVGVSSGTDALLVALMALGIGAGDEVIVPTYSFFATAGVVSRLGAVPVFADIKADTFNIDPAHIAGLITGRTKAIIPVHLFGQCADMGEILALAEHRDLSVIEDAAQAIGAEWAGRRAGSMGRIGCLSFFPSKNLGGIGDGGMCVTNDPDLAERLRVLRVHGSKPKYHHAVVGGNFRLDEIQAAVLRVKLRLLDDWTAARQRQANLYDSLWRETGLAGGAVTAPARSGGRHVFNQYVILTDRRDDLKRHLDVLGIETQIYYPLPLNLQTCFIDLGQGKGALPVAERIAATSLALPIFPELGEERLRRIVSAIGDFFAIRS